MIAYKYFIDTAPYIYCLEGDNSLSNKTKEFFKETTGISSIEAAKGNAKVKKLFRNGKICIGDYTIAGLRVL